MELEITTIYCICEDLLKALCIREDPQVKMSNAEVMTVALTASMYFSGNYERSREFLAEHGYIPSMLSKSRFNRRLNSIDDTTWLALFNLMAEVSMRTNEEQEYMIDSIPVCDNIRIYRSKIYQTEEYRGYIASKKRYFYGIRVHLLITRTGEPVEFVLAPGARNDCRILKKFEFSLPEGAKVYGDKAYNDYVQEDILQEANDIEMTPIRKKNSKRAVPPFVTFVRNYYRKRVETTASQITALFPKSIHAVTPQGFELKVVLFIIAFALQCII